MTSNLSISAISDKEEKRENSKAFLYEKVHLLKKKLFVLNTLPI